MAPPLERIDTAAGQGSENHFLRRARNHEIRRSRRTRTFVTGAVVWGSRLLVAGALFTAVRHGWAAVSASPRYALHKIQIGGAQAPVRHELADIVGRFHGRNLLSISLPAVASEVRRHPWVLDVTVRRILPDAIDVRVRERVPEALAAIDGGFELVDGEGVLLGAPRAGLAPASLDLAVIAGLPPRDEPEALARGVLRGIAAIHALAELAPEMLPTVSEVRVPREGEIELVLRDRACTVLASDEHFRDQMQKYFQVKDALAARVPGHRHVDLRFRSRVIVRSDETSRGPLHGHVIGET